MASNISDYKTNFHNDWCPGCGDFGILNAIQMALYELKIPNYKTVIFSGIGCSGKTPHFINTYGIHTLHGRVLPFAQGAKISNPDITVIAVAGDGDGLGIGAGHLVAAGRRNVDMTYIIFNNGVYGLTKGQASPTFKIGKKTKSSTLPNINSGVNPILLAITSGFTFVARGYAFDIAHLKNLIISSISHRGSSFLDVIQPCPTYNDINTNNQNKKYGDYIPAFYKLEESDYDPLINTSQANTDSKLSLILMKSLECGDRVPIGIFYKNEMITSYDERLNQVFSNYSKNPPAHQKISNSKLLRTIYNKLDV